MSAYSKKGGRFWNTALLCAVAASLSSTNASAEGGIGEGIGQIISAVGQAVIPGIEAQKNLALARIGAATAVATTRIAADTSMYISTNNTRVALEQTAAAERMNAYNQDSTTRRLDDQLLALREARQSQLALERERFQAEKELNNMKIQLAYQQLEANKQLAEMNLSAELTKAGLISGFVSRDSGAGMTATSLADGRPTPGVPNRLLSSIGGPAVGPTLAVRRTAQIQSQLAGSGLLGQMAGNGLVRGSSFEQPVRLAAAAPLQQSDLSNFQQSVAAPGDPRNGGRSRTSVLVGASGHTGFGVSGRPVLGRPSERPLADR